MNNKKSQPTEDSLFEEFDNLSLNQIKAGQDAYTKAREKASQINLDNLKRLKDPQKLEDLNS